MTVPFAFANLSGNIALAKLDSNFNTPITIGNTSVLLGNTVTTLNNLTLANVTITSGTSNVTNVNVTNITVTNLTATLANVTTLNASSTSITSANIGTLALTNSLSVPNGGTGQVTFPANSVLVGNGTGGIATVAPGNVGNVLTSIGGAWVSNVAMSGAAAGANTQVQYNNSGALGASANLTFDGTNLGLAGGTANGVAYLNGSKVLTTGSALTFNGTNLGIGVTSPNGRLDVKAPTGNGTIAITTGTTTADSIRLNAGGSVTNWLEYRGYLGHVWFENVSELMRLDSSGNLGLGVTPSAWGSEPALELRQSASLFGFSGTTNLIQNAYYNGSNWIYKNNAGAMLFQVGRDGHRWFTAPSGTAGNAITFTQAMTLDASGNLGIGTISPSASAIIDAQSTTKGVRMPNMTTTQKNAIASPAAGLMVFDTTLSKLCVYTGAAWQTITSV